VRKILITGLPGVGKTTLIKRVSHDLIAFQPVGFYTSEIRERGSRLGFELIDLDGRRGLLAHVEIEREFAVGRYGVDVSGFESFLGSIPFSSHATRPVVIDEIGKMECLSDRFTRFVEELMRSPRLVVATIAWKGGPFISSVKRSPEARMYELTKENRESVYLDVRDEALSALGD
jgi:nucleoside-triphosphatase